MMQGLVSAARIREKSRMRLGSLILAGGRSRRMGTPKEALPYGTDTLLGHNVALLLGCAKPVAVLIRGGDQQLPPLPAGAAVLQDAMPEAGPLAAMVTGMRWLLAAGGLTPSDGALVVACDLPFLGAEAIAWLSAQLGDHQAVMARIEGRLQPLCAVYRLDVLPATEALLREGVRSAHSLAERVSCRILSEAEVAAFDPALRFLKGVNTPEEWRQAQS
jgi:molybdopterin-guanine dinucleotide biosynthesis protein A